jgi:diadenosine tetraphosphate (Ap4A) HIT family hydrolase
LEFPLCETLLNDDSTWPWVILVPRVPGVEEIHDLSESDQQQLMQEIAVCSRAIKLYYDVDKINVGAIGCVCRQLHVHVLGRKEGDIVWPKPVWGATDPVRYEAGAADEAVQKMELSIVKLLNHAFVGV